jgi:hypothetical protein
VEDDKNDKPDGERQHPDGAKKEHKGNITWTSDF